MNAIKVKGIAAPHNGTLRIKVPATVETGDVITSVYNVGGTFAQDLRVDSVGKSWKDKNFEDVCYVYVTKVSDVYSHEALEEKKVDKADVISNVIKALEALAEHGDISDAKASLEAGDLIEFREDIEDISWETFAAMEAAEEIRQWALDQ